MLLFLLFASSTIILGAAWIGYEIITNERNHHEYHDYR